MRSRMLAPVLFVLAVMVSPAAHAVAPAPDAMRIQPSSAIVEVAAHCGPHSHWVRRHRNRHGKLVQGHCAHDHPRH